MKNNMDIPLTKTLDIRLLRKLSKEQLEEYSKYLQESINGILGTMRTALQLKDYDLVNDMRVNLKYARTNKAKIDKIKATKDNGLFVHTGYAEYCLN